ncbi:MAG: HlyD family efflux transporter periplasmic adaptor subunit [Planctomycetota bacterium]|nr:HlyD family efflux transporter periplasmic adaptor subunit [Planctomycetota bacterium]
MRNYSLLVVAISIMPFMIGCGKSDADDAPAPFSAGGDAQQSITLVVKSHQTLSGYKGKYSETVKLPGAAVHGMESSMVLAKVGGYVESIANIAVKRDGQVFNVEADIGVPVEEGDVLAVLHVPELEQELNEKRALYRQAVAEEMLAASEVARAAAMISIRNAEKSEADALKQEKEAFANFRTVRLRNMEQLLKAGSVDRDQVEEVQFAKGAADAARASATAAVTTAIAKQAAAAADEAKAKNEQTAATERKAVAQATVNRLEALFQYRNITAPFKGMIVRRSVDRGDFVRPASSNSSSSPLFKIVRSDVVRVVAYVPMSQAPKMKAGLGVLVENIGGLDGVAVAGTISRLAMALDEESRMMRIEFHTTVPLVDINALEGDEQRHVRLLPGMFATMTVTVNEWEHLPVVPVSAVASPKNGRSYITLEDGKNIPIKVIFNDGEHVGFESKSVKIDTTKVHREVSEQY